MIPPAGVALGRGIGFFFGLTSPGSSAGVNSRFPSG